MLTQEENFDEKQDICMYLPHKLLTSCKEGGKKGITVKKSDILTIKFWQSKLTSPVRERWISGTSKCDAL